MKRYQVTVKIESNEGDEFTYVCLRSFHDNITQREVAYWVDGIEYGTAIVHDGAVLGSELVCLSD